MNRYVIVGAGGVGSALAAGLGDAGFEVALVSRRGPVRFSHAGHTRTLPVAEVASILGTSRSAVTVHLHRGRKRLKALLQEASDG